MSNSEQSNIINSDPPNIGVIKKYLKPNEKTVFTYGDKIYNPGNWPLQPDIIAHELVHVRQQGGAPNIWWEKYLENPAWRLKQELEAYREQWKFIQKTKERNKSMLLIQFAQTLSSEIYGNLIDYATAAKLIKQ